MKNTGERGCQDEDDTESDKGNRQSYSGTVNRDFHAFTCLGRIGSSHQSKVNQKSGPTKDGARSERYTDRDSSEHQETLIMKRPVGKTGLYFFINWVITGMDSATNP
jgi:hypothetical protein